MERREFLNLSTAAIGALLSGPLLNSCKYQTSPSTNDKPNIVFIFIDDLGWKDLVSSQFNIIGYMA